MLFSFSLFFLIFNVQGAPLEPQRGENLLIILVDGVRWDYIKNSDVQLKGFERLAKTGVSAEHVTPVFPANSYPNWYSIATGLYSESHGMVQNYMYDEKLHDYFLMSPHENASHAHWWNQAEPLWITAEKAGIKTKMVWWDGCQVEINDINVSFCEPYKDISNWTTVYNDTLENILMILDEFNKKEYQLAMVYFEPVDATGHKYGPNSIQRKEALQQIDSILDKVQNKMQELNMEETTNFVVVSDHGMTESGVDEIQSINLDAHINTTDIEIMLGSGSLSMILPVETKEEKLYNELVQANLTGLQVFLKKDIPEHFHFKKNHLVLPILLLADYGYYIEAISDDTKMKPIKSPNRYKGGHGYDPFKVMDMKTIFFAKGPNLKNGYTSLPITMVDHYNLFCSLLDLKCLPNNGSLKYVEGLMSSKSSTSMASVKTLIAVYILIHYFFSCL